MKVQSTLICKTTFKHYIDNKEMDTAAFLVNKVCDNPILGKVVHTIEMGRCIYETTRVYSDIMMNVLVIILMDI